MERRQYRNPPIEEAVCEFRFDSGSEWDITVPGLFYEKIKDQYRGKPHQQNSIEAELEAQPNLSDSVLTVKHGFAKVQFPTEDGRRMVAIGPNALSIHTLRPYEGWNEFYGRIEQAFQSYLKVEKHVGVRRIALRYINKIAIPGTSILLDEYFTAAPQTPGGFSNMTAFTTRVETQFEDLPIRLTFALSDISSPSSAEKFEILLDLNINQDWIEEPLPIGDALSHLGELKQREGQAFESLITDRTRELFDVTD
jgi:uncharacterized protein (TIGR04255 family)